MITDKRDKLIWILGLYIILKPIYLFNSGAMQISDFVMVVCLIYVLGIRRFSISMRRRFYQCIMQVAFLCLYFGVVNGVWSLALHENLLRNTLFYLFNLAVFTLCAVLLSGADPQKVRKQLINACLISEAVSVVGIFLGSGSGRAVGFFNNPNQLGYYSMLILTLVFLLTDGKMGWKESICTAMSIMLIVASGSKAAAVSAVVMIFLRIVNTKELTPMELVRRLALLALAVGALYVLLYSESSTLLANKSIMMMRYRILGWSNESDSDLLYGRGYARVLEMGDNILWGMGEGDYMRFQYMIGKEVHSTFISLLVSYGLIGLFGFCHLLFRIVRCKGHTWTNIVILSGMLSYSMTHNGIRNTLMWIILAVMLWKNDLRIFSGMQVGREARLA